MLSNLYSQTRLVGVLAVPLDDFLPHLSYRLAVESIVHNLLLRGVRSWRRQRKGSQQRAADGHQNVRLRYIEVSDPCFLEDQLAGGVRREADCLRVNARNLIEELQIDRGNRPIRVDAAGELIQQHVRCSEIVAWHITWPAARSSSNANVLDAAEILDVDHCQATFSRQYADVGADVLDRRIRILHVAMGFMELLQVDDILLLLHDFGE